MQVNSSTLLVILMIREETSMTPKTYFLGIAHVYQAEDAY